MHTYLHIYINTQTHTCTPSLFQEHKNISVYSPKLLLPNKVKPNPRCLGLPLSHPIWKSCFFPCGSAVVFTRDLNTGRGTGHHPDGQAHGLNDYQANSHVCLNFLSVRAFPLTCDTSSISKVLCTGLSVYSFSGGGSNIEK